MNRRAHWEQVYRTRNPESVSWYEAAPHTSLELIEACRLAPDDAIIDVGGGASMLVDGLLDRGYRDVSVLDIASEALSVARTRLGDRSDAVSWEVADVTEWVSPRAFRLWHDRAVFHFLRPGEEQDAYRQSLERGLRPGGWAILATFGREGPRRCSGLDVTRSSGEDIAAGLGDGFRLERAFTRVHVTPAGIEQEFQWAVLQRLPAD